MTKTKKQFMDKHETTGTIMACNSKEKDLSQQISSQYFDFVDLSPVPTGAQSMDRIIFLNKAGLKMLGAESHANLADKSVLDFVHPDFTDSVSLKFDQVEKERSHSGPSDIKLIRLDGSTVDVEIAINHFIHDSEPAIQFTFYEITKRKDMEDRVLQSRADWEETFNAITDMITIHDNNFNIIYANKSAKEFLQLPSDDGAEKKCFMYYHGTQCPPDDCASCNTLKTGLPANFEIFEPNLSRFIETRSMPRFDRNKQLIGLIHISRDVTSRKQVEKELQNTKDDLEVKIEERTSELKIANKKLTAEVSERHAAVEALQQNEQKYKNLSLEFDTLLNCIPDNLIQLSPDLKILWANKAAALTLKGESPDLTGQFCFDLCCNILSPCENCPTTRSFLSGKEETAEITTIQGIIWDIRAFPIKDESGKVKSVIELTRDVTEKVSLQASSARTRQLASLGELAAGVAHEINNPINNIINYAQILIDEFKEETRNDEIARRIIKDGDRISTIVRSLLSFARIRKEEKSLLHLQDILSGTLALTAAQIRKDGIHLDVDIPDSLPEVFAHSYQIQQVFLNLISNARYALNQKYQGSEKNKKITIKCEETTINNRAFVSAIFIDNGPGIPSDIINNVMNPFFSTKPVDIGTGLGLSISHGIVTEHGGKITIDSVEGKETTITVNIPASRTDR